MTKTPIVPFHIWLPRAHADAPLATSIVLAGTVLKIATYGYLRLCIQIIPSITIYYAPAIQSIAVVSLIYASIATIRQTDIKALIAYSSIGHIAIVIIGIFSNNIIGIIGGIIIGLAHGVISPALFILTGGVLYDRYHTRNCYYYRGINIYIPIWSTIFLTALLCNIGIPLSLNWIGEFLTLAGLFSCTGFSITIIGASTGIVLSACYSIWIYIRIVGGSYTPYLSVSNDINRREFTIVIYLLIPAFIFGIYSEPINQSLGSTIASLIV